MKFLSSQEKKVLNNFFIAWNNRIPIVEIKCTYVGSGEKIKFAKSSLKISRKDPTWMSWRNLERKNLNSWDTTSVTLRKKTRFKFKDYTFDKGEDPRLFTFLGEAYVLVQKFDANKSDIEISVIRCDDLTLNRLVSPLGFNGKNWVPFEYKNELYFFYSLNPIVVLKKSSDSPALKIIKGQDDFEPKWEHDLSKSIGLIRGGSPGIYLPESNKVLGFSHAINPNEDLHAHRLGIYWVDLNSFQFKHHYLTDYFPSFLIDPYGLRRIDNQIVVEGSMAQGDIHLPDSTILNFEIKFMLDDVVKLLKEE